MGTEFLWKAAETAAPGENDYVTVVVKFPF